MGVFLFSPATLAVLIIQGGADRLNGFIQLVDTEGTFIDLFLREFSFIQCHIKSRIEFISVIPRFTDSGIFIPVSVSVAAHRQLVSCRQDRYQAALSALSAIPASSLNDISVMVSFIIGNS